MKVKQLQNTSEWRYRLNLVSGQSPGICNTVQPQRVWPFANSFVSISEWLYGIRWAPSILGYMFLLSGLFLPFLFQVWEQMWLRWDERKAHHFITPSSITVFCRAVWNRRKNKTRIVHRLTEYTPNKSMQVDLANNVILYMSEYLEC